MGCATGTVACDEATDVVIGRRRRAADVVIVRENIVDEAVIAAFDVVVVIVDRIPQRQEREDIERFGLLEVQIEDEVDGVTVDHGATRQWAPVRVDRDAPEAQPPCGQFQPGDDFVLGDLDSGPELDDGERAVLAGRERERGGIHNYHRRWGTRDRR